MSDEFSMGRKVRVQMARPSDRDIEEVFRLASALDHLDDECDPRDDGERDLDLSDGEQCREVLEHLMDLFPKSGGLMRVVFGMATICSPENEIIDPDSTVLRLHPKWKDSSAPTLADDIKPFRGGQVWRQTIGVRPGTRRLVSVAVDVIRYQQVVNPGTPNAELSDPVAISVQGWKRWVKYGRAERIDNAPREPS